MGDAAKQTVEQCLSAYEEHKHQIDLFGKSVREFFFTHPDLNSGDLPSVHTVKYRLKDPSHLREKLSRKGMHQIDPEHLFHQVTDLAGVRVLHLYMGQLPAIVNAIKGQISQGYWVLFEPPKAYTWDPETTSFLTTLGLQTHQKDSFYTSVHYIVKPNHSVEITCEIQIRTLFEEVWGEIDHVLNYPTSSQSIACSEQLKVLAKMVGAGSRLAEAIFRSHQEYEQNQRKP